MSRAEELFQRLSDGGIGAIDALIADRVTEELFLDFKRSANSGKSTKLDQHDRNSLSKAISGFGNAEGGVIVWGVDCSSSDPAGDVARYKVPLENPQRFASLLEGAVGGVTVPPHGGILNRVILERENREYGYVVTLVPRSEHAPHQTVGGSQYFMRAGSSFVPVPHSILAGMFGRRPQPDVFVSYLVGSVKPKEEHYLIEIGILLHNRGAGIARDIFLNGHLLSAPGEHCVLGFDVTDRQHWVGNFVFGFRMNLISTHEIRLAPDSELQPAILKLTLAPPFTRPLRVALHGGCEGGPPYRDELRADIPAVRAAYDTLKNRANLQGTSSVVSKMLGKDEVSQDLRGQ